MPFIVQEVPLWSHLPVALSSLLAATGSGSLVYLEQGSLGSLGALVGGTSFCLDDGSPRDHMDSSSLLHVLCSTFKILSRSILNTFSTSSLLCCILKALCYFLTYYVITYYVYLLLFVSFHGNVSSLGAEILISVVHWCIPRTQSSALLLEGALIASVWVNGGAMNISRETRNSVFLSQELKHVLWCTKCQRKEQFLA